MYELFGLNRMLQFFAGLVFILALLILWWLGGGGGGGAWILLRYMVPSIGAGLALMWIFGETAIFPEICRLPWVKKIVPDIDGQWVGSLESNWYKVKDRTANPGPVPPAIEVNVAIKARLTYVHMTITSDYLRSETLAVSLVRDARSKKLQLLYIFKSVVPNPGESDGEDHLGAARLELVDDGATPRFEGRYWTNRNWRQGHNTAGSIVLRRKVA